MGRDVIKKKTKTEEFIRAIRRLVGDGQSYISIFPVRLTRQRIIWVFRGQRLKHRQTSQNIQESYYGIDGRRQTFLLKPRVIRYPFENGYKIETVQYCLALFRTFDEGCWDGCGLY